MSFVIMTTAKKTHSINQVCVKNAEPIDARDAIKDSSQRRICFG